MGGHRLYDIALPIDCNCMCADETFLLTVWFESTECTAALVDLTTDDYASACTSWNYYENVWTDLVTGYGFPGNLILSADAVCCGGASATEEATWGTIKESYR